MAYRDPSLASHSVMWSSPLPLDPTATPAAMQGKEKLRKNGNILPMFFPFTKTLQACRMKRGNEEPFQKGTRVGFFFFPFKDK